MSTTIDDINQAAENYAATRKVTGQRVERLRNAIEKLRKEHLPGITEAANEMVTQQALLTGLVQSSPNLFTKPRTMVLHGIKVGFQKGKGRIELGDEEKVIERIRKQLESEQAESLIKQTEAVDKKALAVLPLDTLRKLGVTVIAAGDQVIISAVEDDVDKLVASILAEA